MLDYPELRSLWNQTTWRGRQPVEEYLVGRWLGHYLATAGPEDPRVVQTIDRGNAYLFDIKDPGRLIAAWCISSGHHAEPRQRGRQAGQPKGGGDDYHRGHAIAHSMGGGMDINFVPQLGRINIGPFRELERLAVATPGALYWSYWRYAGATSPRPDRVQQGMVMPDGRIELRVNPN